MVMVHLLGKDEINWRHFKESRSRPRPAAVSVAEDDIVMVVVAVVECESCRAVQVWRQSELSSRDGICL
jgi:hypothetical protein